MLDPLSDDMAAFEVLEEGFTVGSCDWDDPDNEELEYRAKSNGFEYTRYGLKIWLRNVEDHAEQTDDAIYCWKKYNTENPCHCQ